MRRPIATLSALALAAGTFAAPSFMADKPAAAASPFSGGIRDKSGAVEQDKQKASDLPEGSCEVTSGDPSGTQAGFTWTTLEPGQASSDKTAWGLSLAFDNSKDRTFADWGFSNSGRLADVLNTGTISSMDVGQTLFDAGGPVTAKADEELDVKGNRALRNLNLNSELTGDKVKQFAEAGASNPVRYAWQGKYTKDNIDGPEATRGSNALFSAVVNPWPSENDNCSPISVAWENEEKLVVKPGEELKVGTISAEDASMPRMVVEAYDSQGKFIGTSNTEASGGETALRIEDNGDVYFTLPEYKDTELSAQQGVRFSVLALPRTVEQLQSAIDDNDGYGHAFEESNTLPRYSKANVIGSHQWSLDDTQFHDPKYDKRDRSIISGVESAQGPLTKDRQSVTFTQVPDLIKDLVKKKEDGGFEAEVEMDEKYVFEGWDATLDPDTYNVTVTAPKNPTPGTFAQPRVVITYSNGSKDELPLLVVVDPNNTQVTDLVKPDIAQGKPNQDIESQIKTKAIMKGHKAVAPAKYEVDESSVPSGWTVTVDKDGKVTAKADDSVPLGTVISPKVKATYPDQTTDEVEVQFQAVNDIKVPTYGTETKKPGEKASLKPALPEKGLSGKESDEAPNRYTFEDGKTEFSKDGWDVTIDETTGKLTTTVPKGAQPGDQLDIPVLAHYESGAKPQKATGTVYVIKGDEVPVYSVESTGPGKPVDHQVEDAPKGSKFSFGVDGHKPILEQDVDGWKYTINPDTGVVTATPPQDAKPGDQKTVPVTVTAPDGSNPKVPVTTVVNLINNWEAEPSYPTETVYPGDTVKLPVTIDKPEGVSVAKENPFTVGDVPAGWTVTVDDKGEITATAPKDAKAGDEVTIPVTVTYEDDSKDTATAVVKVVDVPTREVPFKVEYKYDDTLPAGEYKVDTEGKPGKEKQKKDGTWERTEEPVNEVVRVGTKPAESAKDVTWTVPIPFPTEVRENPNLAPGETKVVQEGKDGEKTFTAKFTAKGDEAKVAEEKTTKEPVTRIVEYGSRLSADELVTTVKKPVPFETEVVFDDTLEAGKQEVKQQGELGEDTVTSTQKIVDGKPSGEPEVKTDRTKEPKKQIIRVGTKTTGENVEAYKAEVPFKVVVKYDPSMPAGESKVTTPGVPGEKTVTIKRDITNSKPGDPQITEEITKQPVDEVITVGTKPSKASKSVTWTAQVPFEVETRPNPELKPGEIKVVQKGVPGEKTYTADFTAKGDQATVTPEEKQTKDPVNEVIEYGPKVEDTSVVTKVEKPVPFKTEIVFDDTLEKGKQVVDQQGELGTEVVTSTQKIVDGKPSGDPEVKTERTKEPKNAKIRVGAAPTQTELTDKQTATIPYETVIEEDPNLEAGKTVEEQAGAPGEKEVTKTWKLKDGAVVGDPETSEKIIKEPTPRKIRVGTKCDCDESTDKPGDSPSDEPGDGDNPGDKPTKPGDGDKPGNGNEPGDKPTKPGDGGSDKPGDKPGQPGGKPGDGTGGAPGASGGNGSDGTSGGDGNKPADSNGSGGSPLPRTGVSVAGTLAAAAVLIAGGVGLLAVRRRPSKR